MSRCLNLTGDNEAKFNELVKAVGRKEAVREFLEAADNDRPIGTPIQVKEKVRLRTAPLSEIKAPAITTQPKSQISKDSEQKYFEIKSIFNSVFELESKLKSVNKSFSALGSEKNVDDALKRAGIDANQREQFLDLIKENPSLKSLKLSDVLSTYLKGLVKDSDRQYYRAIGEEFSNELENVLIEYFDKFNIKREELDNLKDRFGVDSIGVFDVLAKTVYYAKNRNLLTLPEEYGHVFVELLGTSKSKKADNPLYQYLYDNIESWDGYERVYNDYKKLYVYEDGKPNLYRIKKEAIGQAIGIALVRNYKIQKGDKGFWKAVQEVINKLLELIGKIDYISLNATVDSIARDILSKNYSKLNRLQKNTENYNLVTFSETIKNQNKKDGGLALSFMKWYSDLGNILTGSLAYRYQGKTYRPEIDALHDIDMMVPLDVHKIDLDKLAPSEVFQSKYHYDLIFKSDYFKEVISKYPDLDFLDVFPGDKKSGDSYIAINAIWSKNQELKDRFKSSTGDFNKRLSKFTEDELKQIYLFDFFLINKTSDEYIKIRDKEFGLNLAHYNYSFIEKLKWSRPKDVYDYQMWENYDEANVLAPSLNDRFIYFQIQQSEETDIQSDNEPIAYTESVVSEEAKELQKKVIDPMFQDPETAVGMGMLLADFNNKSLSLTEQNRTQATEIIGKLSEQTGVGFNIISIDEAIRITANSANPYNPSKGPAFFYGGEVYFVGDKLSTKIAFHEFAHPIVRALRLNNPELFDSLYQEAMMVNPEYLQEAIKEYEDLKQKRDSETDAELISLYSEELDNTIKEEIVVKALTEQAVTAFSNQNIDQAKKNFFSKLLYNIRQFLRKLFGSKVNVSKLDGNTTLADLAKMLAEGEKFQINTEEISDDLIVSYYNDVHKYIDDMRNVVNKTGNKFLLETMTKVYEGAASQIRYLQSTSNFEDIVDLLTDDFKRGDLQEIKSNLGKYVGLINSVADDKVKDLELIENEVKSFVSSLMRLDFAIKKMQEHLNELKDDIDQDTLHKADYYRNTLDYWEKYIDQFQKALDNAGADANSPINSIVSNIRGNIRKADVSLNAIQTVGITDTLWNSLKIMALEGDRIFEEKIEKLKDRKASENAIEKEYISYYGLTRADLKNFNQLSERIERGDILSLSQVEEHAKLKLKTIDAIRVTKEKIAAKLKGEGRDANWANSFFEGYLYNTDPVIGGFAVYFQNNMIEVDGRIKNRLQEFADLNIKKLLQDAGINLNMVGESGKVLGFVDSVGEFDPETGTFKEKKVWSLLGATKNHRFVIDQFNYEIRELEKQYQYSRNDQDKLLLIDKINERNKHLREWFYQEFDDQYYKDTTLVRDENDTVGKLAQFARDKVLSDIRSLTQPLKNEIDILDKHKEIDAAWRSYRLLFSNFNIDDTLKTGDDLLIAQRLQEYREKSRKYYEFVERPGVFQNALQNVESEIRDQLIKQGYTPGHKDYKELFKEKRDLWLEMNTRVAIKPEFYEKRAEVLERISKIISKLPSTQANELNFIQYWKDILDSVAGYRDDDGQPIGSEMSEGRKEKVRKAQEAMERAKEAWAGFTGLSREDYDRLNELSERKKAGEELSREEFKEWIGLINEQKTKGLSKSEIQSLNSAFAELSELQGKEPTEYYLDQLNSWLEKMDLKEVYNEFAITSFDEKNVDLLYQNEELREALFKADPEFEKWFEKNHIIKKVKGAEKYERLYIWNVIRPKDPKYYETTNIKNENGDIVPVKGLPKMKFYSRMVKKEFRTGYDKTTGKVKPIVGVHIDNRGILENGWLPKIKEGSPYINEEYFRLKNADPNSLDGKKFKALEALTKFHLKSQEGLPRKDRLYLDFPRFEMDNLEMAQAGIVKKRVEEKMNFIKRVFKKLIEWFKGEIKDDPAQNFDTKLKLVRVDAFGDQIDNIPIQGLYNLDYEETSTDIVNSLIRFMMGAEHKKQLLKMNPTAKALKNILEKNEPKDMEKASLWDAVNRNVIGYANKKGKYVRKAAIDNLYEREFLGKRTTGFLSDQKWVINLQNFMFKRAAFAFFTFNPTSDIKNQLGAKYQAMIEAAAGENLTVRTFAKGQAWSAKYMFQGTFGMYNAKKGLDDQIGDAFDFVQDRFKQRAGEPFTDTVFKDVARFTFLQGPRKLLELEAASQTFAGMMYKKKVSRNGVDIDYMDAWELDASGLLKLKDGIDIRYSNTSTKYRIDENDTAAKLSKMYNIPEEEMRKIMEEEWNVKRRLQKVKEIDAKRKEKLDIARTDSEKQAINSKYDFLVNKQLDVEIDNVLFKGFRNKVQAVMQKLNGAYAQFAQPEAARYILFRFVLNFRRFFITGLMRRFGKERWNAGYGMVDEGYYRTFIKGVKEAFIKMDPLILFGKNDKRVLAATLRVVAEIGGLLLLDLFVKSFGFDLDDEDKYEKLRKMSGPLPIGFVDEDENDFNLFGWLSLHTLNLAYQVRAENEQFVPLSGFGLDNFKDLMSIKAIAMGPTIDSYVNILGDILNTMSGNERAYYKRRSGPYEWQQEGSNKFWGHLAKSFGVNATFIDPASALTNTVKAQNLSRGGI